MPPKNCAACSKLVFPVEELKCLDKTWHKACFKCQVCNMTLNMKNYKGYDKLPYCNAHYPQTKHTQVADTPEVRRIAQNTKIQSNIKYHEEFEKAKGQYTAIADDPETLRVKKNMETISNISYHGDIMKKQEMENYRPTEYEPSDAGRNPYVPPQPQPPMQSYQPSQFLDFTAPVAPPNIPLDYRPPNQGPPSYSRPVVTIGKGGSSGAVRPAEPQPQPQAYRRQPGSISEYDPMSAGGPSPYTSRTQSTTVYSSQSGPGGQEEPEYAEAERVIGYKGYDLDPSADIVEERPHTPPPRQMAPPRQMVPQQMAAPRQPQLPQQPQPPRQSQPPPPRDPYAGKGRVSKAIYDYSAADTDEVSFNEDDLVVNCQPIDEGWMMGTVERTGQYGMLPANYVERLNW